MYYFEQKFPQDYGVLENILANESLWEDRNTTERVDINDYDGLEYQSNLLSIIRKESDELVYSNLLAYFFEQNRSLFLDFTKDVLGIDTFSKDYQIIRESKSRIDLWVEDEKNVIVIENKIKSKVNGERHDLNSEYVHSQLANYYNYAKTTCPDKDIHCFIFTPDYNYIDLKKYKSGEYYKLINYSQIYDFYLKNAGSMLHTPYFKEFIDALGIHAKTRDNRNYEIMKERFIQKIRKILDK